MNYLDRYLKSQGTNRNRIAEDFDISPSTLQRAAESQRETDGISGYILKTIAKALEKSPGTVLDEMIDLEKNPPKNYGIEIYEKDNTIGSRDRTTWTEWYETESERDEAYRKYNNLRKSNDPSEIMIANEIANNPYIDGDEVVTRTYTKINKG
ncbi:hypothetical protein [Enterococcus sp. DIV0800]|uniref:hypothetical protein n=1 Tax=unclassified Enterococcus TaxID=2608891 RepID=UPI003D2FAE07